MIINRLTIPIAIVLLTACGADKQAPSADAEAAAEQAQALLAEGASADGEALYVACQACHGAKGEGNRAMNAPALVNQSPWYTERQLLAFKNGKRGAHPKDSFGAQMAAIARTLPDQAAIKAVANYIDSLPDTAPGATVEGDIAKGEDYYTSICGSCHGPAAEGNKLLDSPALAGVDDWYLVRQYENFRAGIRGGGDDKYGRQMVMMAPALPTEADVRNVVAYIQSLAE